MSAGAWVCRSVGDAYVTYWATLMPADEKLFRQSVSSVAESAPLTRSIMPNLRFCLVKSLSPAKVASFPLTCFLRNSVTWTIDCWGSIPSDQTYGDRCWK